MPLWYNYHRLIYHHQWGCIGPNGHIFGAFKFIRRGFFCFFVFFNGIGTKITTESQGAFNCFIFGNGKFQATCIITALSLRMVTHHCHSQQAAQSSVHVSKAGFAQPPCCCLVTKLCQLFCDPETVVCQAPLSMGFLMDENTGVGCHFLLQGIFLTQGIGKFIK